MKKNIYILFVLFTVISFSQNKFSCEDLESYKAKDSSLYDKLPNGKLIFAPYKTKSKLFKVIIKDNGFYYVTRPVMRKIKCSMRKNECSNVKIEEFSIKDKTNKSKIIRG